MNNSIFQNVPDPEVLLGLRPAELGAYLLEHLHSITTNRQNRFNSDNLATEISNQYPTLYKERIFNTIKQGYQWLKNRDYIFDRTLNGFFDFTNKGKEFEKANDFQDSSITTQLMNERPAANDERSSDSSTADLSNREPLLNARYRIISSLSTSGFAHTFLAEDILLPSKRKCVMKQFAFTQSDRKTYERMLERFEREAVNLERLAEDSDQVPDLYAHFPENSQFYLVQEYIQGDTIAARVGKQGAYGESRVREILRSLLIVLKCVHAHSLIHRDIKPENIVIRESDSKLFLIDFGAIKEIARTIVDPFGNPSTTVVIGTPGYMPTEQVLGRPVFASDLYCLGLTAIFMLTGKRPQELSDLRTGEIVWRENATEVSSRFGEILDKAIRSDFRDRFPEAADMLNALNALGDVTLMEADRTTELAPSSRSPLPSDLGDANMPQVATWWLKEFLGPVIELLNYIRKHFNNNSFELTAQSLQVHSQVFDYRINFFQRQKWDDLLSSDVGEYFLNKYPPINDDLASFQRHMDNFDRSFGGLLKSIENSPMFLQTLIDTYERLIQHQRIPRSQYAHFGLEEIAVHLLGQLHLQISNYRSESKDELVRFTAYSLIGLNVEFPKHSSPDDHKIPGFCRDAFQGVPDTDPVITQALEETKNLLEKTRTKSTELWKQLRQDRMEIANRYNATFE
jgi:serine/threonine protein kinase